MVTNPSELALPTSVHLLVLLGIVGYYAFRRRCMPAGPARYGVVVLAIWCYLTATPAISKALINHHEGRFARVDCDTIDAGAVIIVLSSGLVLKRGDGYEVVLDRAGWERTHTAVELWKKAGGTLLFVGGPAPDGKSSQAASMAQVARASGVPASAVQIEELSRNTSENLRNVREFPVTRGDNVWLVTSALHMPRAMATADKMGVRARAYPCDFRGGEYGHWYAWLPNSGGPELFSLFLREWMGLVYYRLRGYAA